MNIHPTLTTHPKYLLFKQELRTLGVHDALEYLLRLWGHCQTKQLAENWGKVEDAYVEAICQWSGETGKLVEILAREFCGKRGWIHRKKSGELIVTSWNEHNESLLKCWRVGRLGGRPKGTSRQPQANLKVNHKQTSSEPTTNPIGLDRIGEDRIGVESPRGRGDAPRKLPSLDDVLAFGREKEIAKDCCQKFFHENKSGGWLDKKNRPLRDWSSALEAYWVSWQKLDKKPSLKNPAAAEGDAEQWWTEPLESLRADALGLAQSSNVEKKQRAGRMMEIVHEREKGAKR